MVVTVVVTAAETLPRPEREMPEMPRGAAIRAVVEEVAIQGALQHLTPAATRERREVLGTRPPETRVVVLPEGEGSAMRALPEVTLVVARPAGAEALAIRAVERPVGVTQEDSGAGETRVDLGAAGTLVAGVGSGIRVGSGVVSATRVVAVAVASEVSERRRLLAPAGWVTSAAAACPSVISATRADWADWARPAAPQSRPVPVQARSVLVVASRARSATPASVKHWVREAIPAQAGCSGPVREAQTSVAQAQRAPIKIRAGSPSDRPD